MLGTDIDVLTFKAKFGILLFHGEFFHLNVVLLNFICLVIVKKCHFGTMVGWVKGFEPLFETYYLSVIAYGRSQINIS